MNKNDKDCLFCKIAAGDIPTKKVYEDDAFIAFYDIHPKAPIHVLIIPKQHIARLDECSDQHRDLLGNMLLLTPKIAKTLGAHDGFVTKIHTGRCGGQEIFHLHVHVLAKNK